jgi:hypothetical protein
MSNIGSRAEVYHGNARKTPGGLTKSDLMMNKHGRIVSRKKHNTAKKEMRLLKHGYGTKSGKFGFVKVGSRKRGSSRKMRGGNISGALSPASADWNGISGSGITQFGSNSDDVQLRAGMSGGRRRSRRMRGGSGMKPLGEPASADWNGISGSGITQFGSNSDNVQLRAGMSGGRRRKRFMRGGTTKAPLSPQLWPNAV